MAAIRDAPAEVTAGDAPVVPAEFVEALRELGLVDDAQHPTGAPLAGGVSSDIWRIDTARGTVCAKRWPQYPPMSLMMIAVTH